MTDNAKEAKSWDEYTRKEKILSVSVIIVIAGSFLYGIIRIVSDPSFITDEIRSFIAHPTGKVLIWVGIILVALLAVMSAVYGVLWLFVNPVTSAILKLIAVGTIICIAYNEVGGWIAFAIFLAFWAVARAGENKRKIKKLQKSISARNVYIPEEIPGDNETD